MGVQRDHIPDNLPAVIESIIFDYMKFFITYSGKVKKVDDGKIAWVTSEGYGIPNDSTEEKWIPCYPENAISGLILPKVEQQILFRFIDGLGHRAVYIGHDPYEYTPQNVGTDKYVVFEDPDGTAKIYFDKNENKIFLKHGDDSGISISSETVEVLKKLKVVDESTFEKEVTIEDGGLTVEDGGIEVQGQDNDITAEGNIEADGDINADGEVKAGQISLTSHTHTVSTAPGVTGPAQPGA